MDLGILQHDCRATAGFHLIRAVVDCPYVLNIEGFGCPALTPIVGAVYDCTFLIRAVIFDSGSRRLPIRAQY